MPYDGLTTIKIIQEMNHILRGSKAYKIYQPLKDEIIIYFSNKDKTAVRLSANASFARVNITGEKYSNSQYPPPFCMLLRKYLTGAVLKDIRQINNDRIIAFDFEGLTGAGILTKTTLIAEIMGKHSNIILTDASGVILDAIKHVSFLKSSVRQVLAQKPYQLPPNDKLSVTDFFIQEALEKFRILQNKSIKNALVSVFSGVSNQLAMSFIELKKYYNEYETVDKLSNDELINLIKDFKNYAENMLNEQSSFVYYNDDLSVKDFSSGYYFCYKNLPNKEFNSINEASDFYYSQRCRHAFISFNYEKIIKELERKLLREENKLKNRIQERSQAEEADIFNAYGNLILSNISNIKKGDRSASVVDYYNNNTVTTIPLREDLSAAQNAQFYFKKYAKAKNALKLLDGLIEESKELIYYISSQLYYLTSASNASEAQEIINELKKKNIIADKQKKHATPAFEPLTPLKYTTKDGYIIYAGKNDKQNNNLTFKLAEKDDIWLHAKDVAGSHVILKTINGKYTDTALYSAALYAAYHSRSKDSEKVAVDYTYASNVKKIPKSAYGKVIYTDQKTLYVTPSAANLKNLTENNDNEKDN